MRITGNWVSCMLCHQVRMAYFRNQYRKEVEEVMALLL